jgi:ribose transport system substrate-binding protein
MTTRPTYQHRTRHAPALIGALVLALSVSAGCSAGSAGSSDDNGGKTAAPSVALSNSYIGNGWRQTMVNRFQTAAESAKSAGLISEFKISNAPGENSATEQVAQVKSILLEKPDILLINPASPSALTPVIKQACAAGIKVVVFDSGIDADCAFVVTNSFTGWAEYATKSVVDAMGGKGNLLISRGLVGSQPESEFHDEQLKVLEAYPDVKVVGEVNGLCDSATAQKAVLGVLSSLPDVDGVVGCGDGLGVAQAFTTAGRDIPALTFEPSGRALEYWESHPVGKGSVAIMSDPGQSVAALYVALELFKGTPIEKTNVFPAVTITDATRADWLKVIKPDQFASWPWTPELVEQQLAAGKSGKTIEPPVPTA